MKLRREELQRPVRRQSDSPTGCLGYFVPRTGAAVWLKSTSHPPEHLRDEGKSDVRHFLSHQDIPRVGQCQAIVSTLNLSLAMAPSPFRSWPRPASSVGRTGTSTR